LKWVLVVVVLVFIAWGFGIGYGSSAGPARFVAQGDGIAIEDQEFERAIRGVIASYSQIYGERLDENAARTLGLERIALDSIFTRKVMVREAEAAGMATSPAEVSDAIRLDPNFQQNGQFIGIELYKDLLLRNNLSVQQYERMVETDLLGEKLRDLIQGAVTVSDAEVREEYERRTLKVGLDYVLLTPAQIATESIQVTAAEIESRFNQRREEYRLPEQRKVRYALLTTADMVGKKPIDEAQIEAFYEQQRANFQTPEQIRARHILIQVESGADDNAARQKAEQLAEQARGGADFAALAKQHSQDTASAESGGDLGLFPRGRMVPEFEQAAFQASPGSIVGPIRTQFGWHVILVEEHQAAREQSLEEVREPIRSQLAGMAASEHAHALISEFSGEITNGADFDATAAKLGLAVQDSGWISSDSRLPEIGRNTDFLTAAFSLEAGRASQPIPVAVGFTVLKVLEIQPSRLPTLEQVRDRVEADVRQDKRRDQVQTVARRLLDGAHSGPSLAERASAEGFAVQNAPPVTWYSSLPALGDSQPVVQRAFDQPVGALVGPITLQEGVVVAQVTSKEPFDPAAFAAKQREIRESLESQRRLALLQGVLDLLKGRYDLRVNEQRIESIAGPAFDQLG